MDCNTNTFIHSYVSECILPQAHLDVYIHTYTYRMKHDYTGQELQQLKNNPS